MKGITAFPKSIDFGEIEKGSKVSKIVVLTNESEETLRLTPWKSCGCTSPSLNRNTLDPGDSAIMKIEFDSSGKSGNQEKSLGVNYYLKGVAQSLTIKFKAKIKKTII